MDVCAYSYIAHAFHVVTLRICHARAYELRKTYARKRGRTPHINVGRAKKPAASSKKRRDERVP